MKNLGAASFMIWFFLLHSENDLLDLLIYLYVREWNALCALFSGHQCVRHAIYRYILLLLFPPRMAPSFIYLFDFWFVSHLRLRGFGKKRKKKIHTKNKVYHLLNWEKKKKPYCSMPFFSHHQSDEFELELSLKK